MERACGVIPLCRKEGEWHVLLVCHREGHWSFPKGHKERGESDWESALRELKEETQLTVAELLLAQPLQERYTFLRAGRPVSKEVVYFVARVEGEVVLQTEEVRECLWLPLERAQAKITFPEGKKVCEQVIFALNSARYNRDKPA